MSNQFLAINTSADTTKTYIATRSTTCFGKGASIYSDVCVSVGYNACCRATNSTALGVSANANDSSVAVGFYSQSNMYGVAIGYYAGSNARDSVAIGYYAAANATSSIAIGYDQKVNSASTYAVAVGHNARVDATYAVALGSNIQINTSFSIGIGYNCSIVGANCVCIGYRACSATYEDSAISIGTLSHANYRSIAVGYIVKAEGQQSVSIGTYSSANGAYSTAFGYSSNASCNNSSALGYSALAPTTNSVQLGNVSGVSLLRCRVKLTTGSDERDKTDIQYVDSALGFINDLTPITYVYNQREKYIDYDNLTDKDKENLAKYGICSYDKESYNEGTLKGTRRRTGIIAQELQEKLLKHYKTDNYADVVNDNFYDFTDEEKAAVPEDIENQLSVNYTAIIPFLTKALQELMVEVVQLKNN